MITHSRAPRGTLTVLETVLLVAALVWSAVAFYITISGG